VDAPAYHVNIELSSGTELRNVSRTLELSPDGRHLLFTAIDASGTTRLWVRRLRDLTATPLEGTESAGMPFWSADGRSVGFFSMQDGMIKRADLAGGPAVNVSRFVFPGGGTWNRDGVILVGGGPEGITQVAAGAALVSVTRVDESRGEVRHHSPRFLPDGRHFLFFASGRRDGDVVNATAANGVYVATLGTNNQKLLIPEAGYAEYASGHLLFMRGQTLMTQPFDVDRLDLTGEARALVDDVQVGGPTASPGGAGGVFSVSANGSLVYRRGSITQLSQLKWFDRSGRPEDTLGEAADHYGLELSPDGKRVAVVTADASGAMDVSVQQIGGTRSRLTFDEVRKSAPVWSPDGQRLVFRAGDLAGDRSELRIKDATGGAEEVLLKDIRGAPSSWSPDGRFILFMEGSPGPAAREPIGGRRDDLFLLPFTPRGAPVRFAQTPLREYVGRISPDGRWVVYSAGRDATRTDVYVSTFPAFGGPWQVSTNGGIDPRWRGDGGEIYYLSSPVGKMMAAEVNGRGTTFQVVTRQELFDLPRIPNYFAWSGYAVSPDGKRFLINQRVDSLTSGVVLVVNWPGLLKD
jgi:Tol biopolymer transport system component